MRISQITYSRALKSLFVLFSAIGINSAALAQERITLPSPVTFTANYAPSTVADGEFTKLTYVIDNQSANPIGSLAFTHTLPSPLTLADGGAATTCSAGELSAPSGGSTIHFSNAQLGTEQSCDISVLVNTSGAGAEPAPTYQNTTSALTYDSGSTAAANTNELAVKSSISAPVFSQAFSPTVISFGAKSLLTFNIDNTRNTGDILSLNFSDSLPDGIEIDTSRAASTTCEQPLVGSEVTVDASANSFTLTANGFSGFPALDAGQSCNLFIPVAGAGVGQHTNVSDGVFYTTPSSSSETTGNSIATLEVTGVAAGSPLLVKSFVNDPVNPGGSVTVEYTITNTSRDMVATDVAFSDDLEAALSGLTLASLTSNSCGGTFGTNGSGVLSLISGELPANSTCTIQAVLDVPGPGGSYTAQTGPVSATIDGVTVTGNQASDTLLVRAAAAPSGSVTFSDGVAGGTSTMTLEITNNSSSETATDITFDTTFTNFPLEAFRSSPANGSTCGASSSFSAIAPFSNPPQFMMTGGELAPDASCTITVVFDISGDAIGGTYQNTSEPLEANFSGEQVTGSAVTGSLTVGGGLSMAFSIHGVIGHPNFDGLTWRLGPIQVNA